MIEKPDFMISVRLARRGADLLVRWFFLLAGPRMPPDGPGHGARRERSIIAAARVSRIIAAAVGR